MKRNAKSDKNLVKRTTFETVDAIASGIMGLNIAWALAKSLSGNALELRQKRVLEFVEAIQNDQATFNESVVSSVEFQDGFVVALTEYIKLRNFLQRRIALKMFKEFALSEDKVEYPLERYHDTLSKLSSSGIKTLAFIKEEVLPARIRAVKEDMKGKNYSVEKPYEWWFELTLKREPVSTHFSRWIHDRYDPNSQQVKDKYNDGKNIQNKKLLGEVYDIKREVDAKMHAPLGELKYLGLVVLANDPKNAGWGATPGISAWTLSDFAYEFIKFIEEAPEAHS